MLIRFASIELPAAGRKTVVVTSLRRLGVILGSATARAINMKRTATTLLASLLWTACSTAQPEPALRVSLGKPFTLTVGAVAQLDNSEVRIGFTGVSSDSRCPKGERCVWAGEAVVQVWMQRGSGARQSLTLRTAAGTGQAVQALGHELRLVQLTPEPVASRPILPAHYVATLVLSLAAPAAER